MSHLARHRVTPQKAEQALINEPLDLGYEVVDGEERWTSVGHTENLRVLLLVWALRGEDVVRVVTAREASKTDQRRYLREKGFRI